MKCFAFFVLILLTNTIQAQNIIVTEINYHSDSTMDSGNWFEIYNAGTTTVNLGGWKFSDRDDINEYIIPTGTNLQANKYLVVVNDIAKFTTMHPTVTNYVGAFSFGLSNNWDKIRLYNQAGVLAYSVTYLDSAGWPKCADGRGRTLEYKGGGLDPNLYSSWFDGCMFGSPGKAWSPCNPDIVISEINYNSDTLYDCEDWFELHNET
ncbi:MAG: lamin tail domain-containing protein, partial [Bacteroidota bacterium]